MALMISIPLGLLAFMLSVPALVLAVECLMASVRPGAACRRAGFEGRHVTKVVVIPAHDEELSIGRTLAALLPELEGQGRILVVADNCADATATVAAGLGVEVLERKDPDRRGKGFALDFALKHLKSNPPEVVVFLDADCELTPGSLEELAQVAQSRGRPAQAHYRMRQDGDLDRPGVAGFAWRLRGLVRPMGLAALGMPCQLYGTGMALPWAVLERLSLASGHIVEDMKLTLDLIEDGALPLFCADACVISAFPATEEAAAGQRRRWEHGHIATLLGHGLPALCHSLLKGDPRRLALALDVCVPPLSLFLLLLTLATLLTLPVALVFNLGQAALAFLGLSWGLTLAGLFLAWFRFGRDLIPARRLLLMPVYVASKLLIYLEFFTRRQKEWNRADRE